MTTTDVARPSDAAPTRERVDVVVVGAGFAGLTTAVDLLEQGLQVIVLEARDRVAGRTTGHVMSDGHTIEMGGEWFGPTQVEVLALADKYGLRTYPQYVAGDTLLVWNGSVHRSNRDESLVNPEIGRLQAELEGMAATLDLEQPWANDSAAEWDAMTLHSWLESATDHAEARAFWRMIVPTLFCAEAHEISLLHFLFYVTSGGMLDMLMGVKDGAQDRRLVGGSHLICEAMARELGNTVRLSSPVYAIEHAGAGAVVHYDGGEVQSQRVVIALPPALAGRLRYTPAMPVLRDQLSQQLPMGSVIKINVLYDRPFWRDDGLSGQASSLEDPLTFVLDNTPDGSRHGVLVGFFDGANARRMSLLNTDQRRAVALECLTKYFGPRAANPLEYLEKDWGAEEYSRGCPGGRFGAGVWTAFGPQLREPVGVIHWAGTETASVWNGYMDGAVRSGHRAANEINAVLSPTTAR